MPVAHAMTSTRVTTGLNLRPCWWDTVTTPNSLGYAGHGVALTTDVGAQIGAPLGFLDWIG